VSCHQRRRQVPDRSKALEIVREREAKAGPVMRALLAVNYALLDEPPPTRTSH
jgi:hypothetical protein